MKKAKKILVMVAALALTAALAIGGTLAYLTSTTSEVKNTFTAGNVSITLDEAKVDVYGVKDGDTRVQTNTYKLIPGHTYLKDPTVHVAAGSEECWLFVKVVDGLENAEADTTIAAQMEANGWDAVEGAANVFAYESKVDARNAAVDKVVFGNFTLKGDVDVESFKDATITIMAYAVQADSFGTAAEAWAVAPSNWGAEA